MRTQIPGVPHIVNGVELSAGCNRSAHFVHFTSRYSTTNKIIACKFIVDPNESLSSVMKFESAIQLKSVLNWKDDAAKTTWSSMGFGGGDSRIGIDFGSFKKTLGPSTPCCSCGPLVLCGLSNWNICYHAIEFKPWWNRYCFCFGIPQALLIMIPDTGVNFDDPPGCICFGFKAMAWRHLFLCGIPIPFSPMCCGCASCGVCLFLKYCHGPMTVSFWPYKRVPLCQIVFNIFTFTRKFKTAFDAFFPITVMRSI